MPEAKDVIDIFVEPGGFFIGNESYRLRTILGSCVSVTLWHPGRLVGAMTHFLLPSRTGELAQLDGRYGEEAMWWLLRELVRIGIAPPECHAKIFGGGNMFPQQTLKKLGVGHKNGEAARRVLRNYGVPIVSESLFGFGHRQVIFDIASGDVWVRHVELPDPLPGR